MPDNKQNCKTCKTTHFPSTGKKCRFKDNVFDNELTMLKVSLNSSVPNGLGDAAI